METIRYAFQNLVTQLHHDSLFTTGATVCLSPQDAETDESWAQVLESNKIRFTEAINEDATVFRPLEQAVLKLLRDPVFRKARVLVSDNTYETSMAAVFFSFPYASAEISWISAYESSYKKYLTIESPFVLNERHPEHMRVLRTSSDKNFIKAARELIRPLTIEDMVRHVGKTAFRQIADVEREVRYARKSLENEIRGDESLLRALGRVDKYGQVSLGGGLISKIRSLNDFEADRKEVGKGSSGNTTCALYRTHTFSDETIFHTVLLNEVDWNTSVKVGEPTTYTTSTLPEEVSRKISTIQVYGEDVEGVGVTIKPGGIYYIFL